MAPIGLSNRSLQEMMVSVVNGTAGARTSAATAHTCLCNGR